MKVYDCFIFYNEIPQLLLRLKHLESVVDYFIIVEATSTHSGKPKPLYLAESPYGYIMRDSKVKHAVIDFPEGLTNWGREQFQREAIHAVLENLNVSSEDYILVSDVDEIPNPESIQRAIEETSNADDKENIISVFEQRIFNFRLNYELIISNELPWLGTCGSFYKKHFSPNRLRSTGRGIKSKEGVNFDSKARVLRVKDGGSHFSYLGDDKSIAAKLLAFAHQEERIQKNSRRVVEDLIAARVGLFPYRDKNEVWAIIDPDELDVSIAKIVELELNKFIIKDFDGLKSIMARVRSFVANKKIAVGRFWFGFGKN